MTDHLPANVAPLPPLTACDPKSMSPQECADHRERICLEVEIVMKGAGYFESDRSAEMSAAVKAYWADELESWTPDQVRWAMRKWARENPGKRPGPGHILALVKEGWGKRHAEAVRAAISKPAEPKRDLPSPERRAEIAAEAAAILKGIGL